MTELILREDVPSLGRAGEVVRVKPGYARNYLLPRGLAFEATEGNKKRIAAESKAREARAATDRAAATDVAQRLAAVTLQFTAKAGEDGKLFGSITANDIATELGKRGLEIDRRKIELPHPLKTVGEHAIPVRLHADVHAEVKVTVAAGE